MASRWHEYLISKVNDGVRDLYLKQMDPEVSFSPLANGTVVGIVSMRTRTLTEQEFENLLIKGGASFSKEEFDKINKRMDEG